MALDLSIAPIYSPTPAQRSAAVAPASEGASSGALFADFFSDALTQTVETDAQDKLTNLGLMMGDLTDLHTATIAAEKADIALSLTLQIRNKVVEAYQEIMRMSV